MRIDRYEKGRLNYKLLLNLFSFSETFIFLISDVMIKKIKSQNYYPERNQTKSVSALLQAVNSQWPAQKATDF